MRLEISELIKRFGDLNKHTVYPSRCSHCTFYDDDGVTTWCTYYQKNPRVVDKKPEWCKVRAITIDTEEGGVS